METSLVSQMTNEELKEVLYNQERKVQDAENSLSEYQANVAAIRLEMESRNVLPV
jgi:hypothetical protein